ncbi:hypothetical protein [Bradyrhizobium symbiodeficiens]|uniref:Uncharacterized protein n=1 Tax=Bradyrhizobium symbiodeficiens TaxID=1404367 RepID=A0A6G9A1A5_9BRAD|nr:hypothetical protein [Bradyrhizobium symbiodeficiens]QIP06106.1 hypothetical protein HAV00_07525 [Bradyrhizobium symbiodeficiens]
MKLNLECKDSFVDFELLKILVAWRNQHVHDGLNSSGEFRLPDGCEAILLAEKDMLAKRYGGFDPSALFHHFIQRDAPKRKEIITLVSACQNFVRAIDGALLRQSVTRNSDLQSIALATIKKALCRDNPAEIKKVWGKDTAARERRLRAALEAGGFSVPEPETEAPLSPNLSLPADFIENFARISVQQVIEILNAA